MNLEEAETMIRAHYKWREENKIDSLLELTPDNYFVKNFKHWLNGVNRKGRPVLCIAIGDWDVTKIVEDDKIEEFMDYINRIYERLVECIIKANERRNPEDETVTQFLYILDWSQFTGRQTANIKAIQTLIDCAMVYEAHYPEILGQAFFININPFFQMLFKLLKQKLAARTLSKIECYGSDRSEWEPIIRAVVEEHQIPRQFGG